MAFYYYIVFSWFGLTAILVSLLTYFHKTLWWTDSEKEKKSHRHVCLVIAHPDDECMFFGPILLQLQAAASSAQTTTVFYVLCLTNGDFYGQGRQRVKELEASCKLIVPACADITISDQLPDTCDVAAWDMSLCKRIVAEYVKKHSIDLIVTFDSYGVSGHTNHRSTFHAIESLKLDLLLPGNVDVLILESVPIWRKYLFVLDLPLTLILYYWFNNKSTTVLAVNTVWDYVTTVRAMQRHQSQLVWFRWIYIFTSRYMFINTLRLL